MHFTDEQERLRSTVRRFAQDVVAPLSREIDRSGKIPPEVRFGLAELGVLGMTLPEEHGGAGASSVDIGVVMEELARADFSVAHIVSHHALGAQALAAASATARSEWLPGIIDGSLAFAFALTEPAAGSDAGAITCRAERTSTGYRLNGEKTSISFLADAAAAVVIARTDAEAGRGITAFYVPLDAPGVTTAFFDDLGCRGMTRGTMWLSDVEIPAERRLGDEGGGFQLVMNIFDLTRTLIALAAVSAAQASIDEATEYATERVAFGVPIGAHQGVSFELAEHQTKLAAARLLCYNALEARDAGRDHTVEAAMAKWLGVVSAREAAHAAMLVMGHSGYTEDLQFEQRLRDIIGMEWGDGTANACKIVIARSMLGRRVTDAVPLPKPPRTGETRA